MNVEQKTYYVSSEIDLNCPISHDKMENPARTSCNHFFDSANILQWVINRNTCPICRTPLSERDIEVVKLSLKPVVPSVEDRTSAAAAAAMPAIPSSALPILPVVIVPDARGDVRIEARDGSASSPAASSHASGSVHHHHRHHHNRIHDFLHSHHHSKNRAAPHKHAHK